MCHRLSSQFRAARNPANNQAVQRLLLRAAYVQNSDALSFRSLLEAANTLAILPCAGYQAPELRHGKRKHCQPTCSVLQPAVLRGVGSGVCRIVGEAMLTQQSSADPAQPSAHTPSSTPVHTLPPVAYRGVGAKSISYDEATWIHQRIAHHLRVAFDGKALVSIIGPLRRGAPYVSTVELLVTHTSLERDQGERGGLRDFVDKASRALDAQSGVPQTTTNGRMDFSALTEDAPPAIRGAQVVSTIRWGEEVSEAHGRLPQVVAATAGGVLVRRVRIRWTTYDRYVPQLFLLTGPELYVAGVLQHAAQSRGLDLSLQGIRKHPTAHGRKDDPVTTQESPRSHPWLQLPSELSLFAEVRLPYLHPFNRA
jgi:hypothetical protein